jgi:hypothetical protein
LAASLKFWFFSVSLAPFSAAGTKSIQGRDNSRRDCGRDVALLSSYRAEGTGIILLQQSRRTLLGMVPTSGHDDDDCWESG